MLVILTNMCVYLKMNTKKFNIVLDIDETLIHSFEEMDTIFKLLQEGDDDLNWLSNMSYVIHVTDPNEDGTSGNYSMWGLYRCYLEEFISYIIENFRNVYIFSAGSKKYINKIVENIFTPLKYKPPIILDYNHINHDKDTGNIQKPLSKILEQTKGEATIENTIIIDDREDTFELNIDNGILIPRFSTDDENGDENVVTIENIKSILKSDKALQELIVFFEKNKHIDDVRKWDKSNIFSKVKKEENRYSAKMVGTRHLSPSHNIKF